MLNRIFTLLAQSSAQASPALEPVGPPLASPPFTSSRRAAQASTEGADRHQRLIGLALENLMRSARRSSVSDMTAAAIDLKRVAYGGGKVARDLLNKPDPSGTQILDCVAQTRVDIHSKLNVLMSMGCELHAVNRAGENVLHAAARHNNVGLVDAVSAKGRGQGHVMMGDATARVQSYSQATPLAVAVVLGHAGVARQFVLLGVSLSAPCCVDADQARLNPQELYAQLDNRTPAMSTALRTARTVTQAGPFGNS